MNFEKTPQYAKRPARKRTSLVEGLTRQRAQKLISLTRIARQIRRVFYELGYFHNAFYTVRKKKKKQLFQQLVNVGPCRRKNNYLGGFRTEYSVKTNRHTYLHIACSTCDASEFGIYDKRRRSIESAYFTDKNIFIKYEAH